MSLTPGNTSNVFHVLWRWRGSVWKAIWRGYLLFIFAWFGLHFLYRFLMPQDMREAFQDMVAEMASWGQIIPLQFLLGFYVTTVFGRWWDSMQNISFPDRFLTFVNVCLPDAALAKYRKTFYRLINLQCVLCWREISLKTRRRFPTMQNVLDSGLITTHEHEMLEGAVAEHGRWMLPTHWMTNMIVKLYNEDFLTDYGRIKLTNELLGIRGACGALTIYDWLNVPLVYLQVTRIATYGYFLFALISRQPLQTETGTYKLTELIPLMTTLEFIFYIGWLKVGDTLLSPFGEDDEDFDMNYILDRNIYIGHAQVGEWSTMMPSIDEEPFGGKSEPQLPYTIGSMQVDYPDTIPPWKFDYVKFKPRDLAPYEDPRQLKAMTQRNSKEGVDLIPDQTKPADTTVAADAPSGPVVQVFGAKDAWTEPGEVTIRPPTRQSLSRRPIAIPNLPLQNL